jgi:hypothetical protein
MKVSAQSILDMIQELPVVGGTITEVGTMIDAGVRLAEVVRANIEEAVAVGNETDLVKLKARAAELATINRALAEQVDALLS